MAHIKLVNENRTLVADNNARLKDVLEPTNILFGCSNGLCGTCMIEVIENPDGLAEKENRELDTLNFLSAEPNQRLACQCKVKGDCTIRYINEI
jgi:ferredoxin